MRKLLLMSLALGGVSWGQATCHLRPGPFLELETGVRGGIALRRDTILFVIPEGADGARVWLNDHGHYRKGRLTNYGAFNDELVKLGLYDLKTFQPYAGNLDPYGSGSSLHAHDGKRCFHYSPQRDCSLDGQAQEAPSPEARQRFAQISGRIRSLEKQATAAATRAEFEAAQQVLWKT